jgi:hypothetical protein
MNATGSRECTNAFGAASESQPKFVAKSDPAAQCTRAEESRPYFAYATNYLVDTKCSVIMEFTLAAIAQNLRKLAKLRPAFSQMKVAT